MLPTVISVDRDRDGPASLGQNILYAIDSSLRPGDTARIPVVGSTAASGLVAPMNVLVD